MGPPSFVEPAAARVAAGAAHSVAVIPDGSVRAWGAGTSGQLGDGESSSSSVPVAVSDLTGGVRAVAAGGNHSLALLHDRTLRAWGSNDDGELGDGTTIQRSSPVAVSGLTGVSAIATGPSNSVAVASGALYAWGENFLQQVGDGTTIDRHAPVAVVGATGTFTAVAQGANHTLALSSTGTVWSWGLGTNGQLGRSPASGTGDPPDVIPGLTNIVEVAAAGDWSMARDDLGRVWTWGRNTDGQLGRNCIFGTCIDSAVPGMIAGLSEMNAVAAGESHGLAIAGDDTARAWGANSSGQLGDGTTTQRDAPVAVFEIANAVAVAGGASHSLAVRSDTGFRAWGLNSSGQVGDGTTTTRLTQVAVSGLGIPNDPADDERNGGGSRSTDHRDPCKGQPVNCATGNFWHTFTDLSIPGRGSGFVLERTYNSSRAAADGPFGFGWDSSLTMSLDVDAETGTATITEENGSLVTLNADGAGGFYVPPRLHVELVENVDGSWTFTRRKHEIFDFDPSGRLAAIRDLNGYEVQLSYPDASTIVATDPAGRTITMSLTGGRVTSVSDSSSPARTLSYTYDGSGNLTHVVDVNGGTTTFGYDGSHRVLTMRMPGHFGDTTTVPVPEFTNVYDGEDRVVSQTDPLGREMLFDYTTVPGSTRITDPEGNVEVEEFEDGLLVSLTRGAGSADEATWTYEHDPDTLGVTKVTDPLDRERTRTYDAAGNVLSETDALDRETVSTYDALNRPLTITDPAGDTTTMTYDGAGNLLTTSRPLKDSGGSTIDAATTTLSYDGQPGDVTKIADPLGKEWTYDYNAQGDRVSATDPLGNTTTSVFDTAGRMTSMVSARGNASGADPADYTTTYEHDPDGLVTKVTDPEGGETLLAYDANRNLVEQTDPNGNETTYAYDPADQLVRVERPDDSELGYEYDDNGNVTTRSDGAGADRTYAYDPLDRMTTTTDPLSRETTISYDLAGNRASVTDPQSRVASLSHDVAGQVTAIDYSDPGTPDVTGITYDDLGRRVAMTDQTGTSTWAYDSLGRLTSSATAAGTIGYAHDLADRLTSISYPNGVGTITRGYDDAGRLTSVKDPVDRESTFGYDADGNVTTRGLANGVTDTLTYDHAGRLSGIGVEDDTSTELATFAYVRDPTGQLESVASTGLLDADDHDYGYTQLNQLQDVDTDAYAYDPAENLTALLEGTHQAFNTANELCFTAPTPGGSCGAPPTGATTYAYDQSGSRTMVTPPSGPAQALGYDQADRLTSVTEGSLDASYAYDGDGLRISKTVDAVTTSFAWDASQGLALLLTETTGTDTTAYLYGPGGQVMQRLDPSGDPVYYSHDQLGSVRLITDQNADPVATYTYDPYGNTTNSTGTLQQPFGYAGEYHDAETGLVYLRARYYDPGTGQFLTRDPLETLTGQAYAYANNNPITHTDPSGEAPPLLVAALILGGGGAAGGAAIDFGSQVAGNLFRGCGPLDDIDVGDIGISAGLGAATAPLPLLRLVPGKKAACVVGVACTFADDYFQIPHPPRRPPIPGQSTRDLKKDPPISGPPR
ncbi:MAG: RHS repeat-associated core domain-containing protein [Solirubrobacteraceae bacterium]|nr:RHS repeat-associated core domain-containing protein [Solirubrobacteraceae bacterium]